ncbi:T9SS type A sorting domain-containing protein [Pontibacter sp. BT310]|uniref:T9SS type A sorting domain-containing protein n=1 Tax=Pontibacter populi TaxID=890055 RepID=A0ABS6XAF4_9BACT|nr:MULTISPECIES: Ig-like domain-containing protein [Pontibacter]MBJ6118122.1 T9SS type A sorting domain-containing protein [Pontibacter sp. BT310]MBR0570549.1 T9SS type A sorting domain-containing protein [Microvirga sp. STS03]MBW3364975.1 T9SS type A sorting domain-containing protein [Pontibacter populi]
MHSNFYAPFTGRLLRFVLFLLCFTVFHPLQAQHAPHKLWDKTIGATYDEALQIVIQTNDGGYLLGGYSGSGVSGDKSETSRGGVDYWVVKTDAAGNKQWDRTFGGSGADILSAVQQTSDGGYILGGYSRSPKSGDRSQDMAIYDNLGPNDDYWIVRIDGQGNKLWDKRFGSYGDDHLSALRQTTDGGFILGGHSSSGFVDKSEGSYGQEDYWVVKIDAAGKKQWDKTIGGNSVDYLSDLQQTSDGGYILGGRSYSSAYAFKSQPSKGDSDYWIVKLDGSGKKEWDKTLGGSWTDDLRAIQQTPDGGYILVGDSKSGRSGDKSQAVIMVRDYWILRLDAAGNKMWDTTLGGTGDDYASAVIQTDDGGFLIGGYTTSGTNITIGDKSQPTNGGNDYWLIKVDGNGSKSWDLGLGSKDNDNLYAMQQTTDKGFILGGYTAGVASGDKSDNSIGARDFWLVKLSTEGVFHQAATIATSEGSTEFTEAPYTVPVPVPVAVDPGFILTAGDKPTLLSANIHISSNFKSDQDILGFSGNAATTGNITAHYDAAVGRLSLHSQGATATLQQWQAALRAVTYANTSRNPDLTPRVISFTVNDGHTASGIVTKTITITPANDPPSGILLSTSLITENIATGTTVASLSTTDDNTDGYTYTLVEGTGSEDNALFTISGSALKVSHIPDFEVKKTYTIRIRSTDTEGLFVEKPFTLSVKDLDEIPPTGSFTINSGSSYTNQTSVTLTITQSGASTMRLSNNGVNWGSWTTVKYTTSWSLMYGDGKKTVYLQLKDDAGNVSEVYANDIILDQTPPALVMHIAGDTPHTTYPVVVDITFTEPVTGFIASDIVVEGGTIGAFSGSEATYTLRVIPAVKGDITITIAAGKATDAAGNLNTASPAYTINYQGHVPPALTTSAAHSITPSSATIGGEITDNGGSTVLERGIVYSSTTNITTIAGPKLVLESGDGAFSGTITDLQPSTRYFARAYAMNDVGISYGNQVLFTTAPAHAEISSMRGSPRLKTKVEEVIFYITFSYTIYGLTAENFSIATEGLTGAYIKQVSNSLGSTVAVRVVTGTGEGTIELRMENDKGASRVIDGLPATLPDKFTIDRTPPVLSGIEDGAYYNTEQTVTFTEGAALLNENYTYTGGKIVLSDEKYYKIRLTDEAGNYTEVTCTIDKRKPTTNIIGNQLHNEPVTVTFSDNWPSPRATLNGEPIESGVVVSQEGEYTVVVTDQAGNSISGRFTIDLTPPVITGVEDNGKYNSARTIFFEGNGYVSALRKYSVEKILSGTTLSDDAEYTLYVTDEAGNRTILNFKIDKVAPIITGVADGEAYNHNVHLYFNEGTATLNGTKIYSGAGIWEDGNYEMVAQDDCGNQTTVRFIINKTGPAGAITINKGVTFTNNPLVQLEIIPDDAIEMRFSNGYVNDRIWSEWEAAGVTKTWNILYNGEGNEFSGQDGDKYVFMELRDNLGNISTHDVKIRLDRTAPRVHISSTVSSITTQDPVLIQLNFDEPVEGFTIEDVVVSGAEKHSFSGSEASYNLEIKPSLGSMITVEVPKGATKDKAGNLNKESSQWRMSSVTGLEDLEKQARIEVFPNPVHSDLHILLEGLKRSAVALMLYDSKGKLVFDKSVRVLDNEVREKVAVAHLAPGIYFLYLSDGKAATTKKVVVN